MPDNLSPAAYALIQQARAAKPEDYGNLSDMQTLTLLLERNPEWDRGAKLQEWGADSWTERGSGTGWIDTGASAVKGFLDAFNPTQTKIPESIGDSKWGRIGGEVAGNLVGFSKIPKLAAGIMRGAGAGATALDVGLRGLLGWQAGARGADDYAETQGEAEASPEAGRLAALGGALMGGSPLNWSAKAGRNAAATAGTIMGGAGMTGASMASQDQTNPLLGALSGMLNPVAMGLAAGGAYFGHKYPGRFQMSTAEAAPKAPAAPQGPSTSVLGGGAAPGANIPPRPTGPPTADISTEAINRALTVEGIPGLEGLTSQPVDRGALGQESELLRNLDILLQIRHMLQGAEPKASAFEGSVYTPPIEGVVPEISRISGTTSFDTKVGDKLIPKQDLFGELNQIFVSPSGQKYRIPPGFGPMSGGRTFEDMLAEDLALQMGIGRNVQIYGRGMGENMGQYLAFDPADAAGRGFPLPEAALPQTKLANERRAAAEAQEAIERNSPKVANAQGRGPLRYEQADPNELVNVIMAHLEKLRGGLQ